MKVRHFVAGYKHCLVRIMANFENCKFMKTTTILIVGTDMMNIYNHRLELIRKLLSLDYKVIVAAPRGGEEQALIKMGVKFIDTHVDNRGTNIKNDLKLLKDFVTIIKKEKPDVVLTFYTKTNIYGGLACRLTNTPYIENITGLGSAVAKGGTMQKLMIMLYGMAVKKAETVFFQNNFNEHFFKDHHIRVRRSIMLPGSGVSLKRFEPLVYPDDQTIEFLFVSRVIKEKGIEEYVEAAKKIKVKYPATLFHVVGPAHKDYEEYLRQAQDAGIIKYHGKTFDVMPYLRRSHCTVFPSYYAEGMANVLLESASSGRPIITTSCPGCGETVDDKVSGFLVKEKDVDDLIEKLESFITLPYQSKKKMGLAGRKKMEKEFDRNIVIDAYVSEIKRVCLEKSCNS